MKKSAAFVVAPFVSLAFFAAVFPGCSDDPAPPPGGTPGADGSTGTDGGPLPVLAPCATPSGPGTEHKGDITADETWTAAASPHRITFGTRILSTVKVEACATVLVDEGYTITVGDDDKPGALVAKGERGVDASGAPLRRAVTFAASDPQKPWGSIAVDIQGKLDLESTILRDAANERSDQNGGGAVVVYGQNKPSTLLQSVRVKDVRVENARGFGFNFLTLTGFTDDSSDLTVTGSGRAAAAFPIRMPPGALRTVPPNLQLSGNAADEVQIVAANVAMASDTIRARGVPYRVSGRIRVAPEADGAAVTLTIEAGVTLRFDDDRGDNGLQIGTSDVRQGILVAEGTAAAPITFTSAKSPPAAANWKNIYFSHSPSSGNRITHAIIEYAGAPSGAQGYGCGPVENDASILILSARPSDAFIQNTTFRNGGGDTGLLLGWSSDMSGPDFVATNTFTNMPSCKVSRWRNETGNACPGSVNGSPLCF